MPDPEDVLAEFQERYSKTSFCAKNIVQACDEEFSEKTIVGNEPNFVICSDGLVSFKIESKLKLQGAAYKNPHIIAAHIAYNL